MKILDKAFTFVHLCGVLVASKYCFWNAGCTYKLFSSKTPYGNIRGDLRDSAFKIEGCEPISIWSIMRHGHRYPGTDYGNKIKQAITLKDEIVSSHAKGKSALCAQDIENIKNWIGDDRMFSKPHYLSDEGYAELLGIGKRLREVYLNFLSPLQDDSYIFRPASGQWMEDSLKAFVEGLATKDNKIIIESPKENYDYLEPYSTCEKYQKDVKLNPATYRETETYERSQDFVTMKERIQKRLGIDYKLTNENITSLYDMCRYSWSTESKPTPWCALFTTDDLRILEYIGDLRHYYRNGYGLPANLQFGATAMQDLYKHFQQAKKGNGKKIVSYVTHASMMDMIYSALGLFRDDFVLNGSYRVKERKWRTSTFSSFSSNIIAVLNKCDKEMELDYTIVFYLNEKRITLCPQGWCSWKQFEDKFKLFSNETLDFCDNSVNRI